MKDIREEIRRLVNIPYERKNKKVVLLKTTKGDFVVMMHMLHNTDSNIVLVEPVDTMLPSNAGLVEMSIETIQEIRAIVDGKIIEP